MNIDQIDDTKESVGAEMPEQVMDMDIGTEQEAKACPFQGISEDSSAVVAVELDNESQDKHLETNLMESIEIEDGCSLNVTSSDVILSNTDTSEVLIPIDVSNIETTNEPKQSNLEDISSVSTITLDDSNVNISNIAGDLQLSDIETCPLVHETAVDEAKSENIFKSTSMGFENDSVFAAQEQGNPMDNSDLSKMEAEESVACSISDDMKDVSTGKACFECKLNRMKTV